MFLNIGGIFYATSATRTFLGRPTSLPFASTAAALAGDVALPPERPTGFLGLVLECNGGTDIIKSQHWDFWYSD
jgi:hypothetical protein